MTALVTVLIVTGLSNPYVQAGWNEGVIAYKEKDYKKAFKEFFPLAEANDKEAQYWIGRMYRFGLGRDQDYKAAVNWFKRAVNNGSIATLIPLGYMAGKGRGMPKSVENEICYYRYAAERGDETAQWSLYLTLREQGKIIEAQKWRLRSLKQGEAIALAREGEVQLINPFVKDKTEALMYLTLAVQRGEPRAQILIDAEMENNPIRQKQLEKAKVLAARWKPVKEVPPTGLPPIDISKCEK